MLELPNWRKSPDPAKIVRFDVKHQNAHPLLSSKYFKLLAHAFIVFLIYALCMYGAFLERFALYGGVFHAGL